MPPTRPSPSPRRWLATIAATAVFLGLMIATPATAEAGVEPAALPLGTAEQALTAREPATGIRPAADLSSFRPGNIVSDAVFTNADTLNAAQIQAFFQGKVSACQPGYTCLKDYRQNTVNRPADRYCNGYTGSSNELASTIIAKAAQSCGINPQVLVVMLQKEQGLVTHTWPSSWRYDAALGQGCPDDAACDPNFVGFFHQIYGAARQMKIYMEGIYFTWYAPGKTWDILYNPDRSCGSSPVHIENAATSALYYYTPYQPNRAALAAGYGEGDRCSAYGNRNFYNYFTDWFGSTQGAPAASLVTAQGYSDIFLLANGRKHRVASWEELTILSSRLGHFAYVPRSVLDAAPTGGTASRYAHDPRTGTLYLLQEDGTKHAFASADTIGRFGYSFGSYVDLTGSQMDAFTTGPPVGDFFRADGAPEHYLWQNSAKRWIVNDLAWNYIKPANGFVAFMQKSAFDALPTGTTILAPASLVRESSSGTVSLVGQGEVLAPIPSFALAADAGAVAYRVVPDGVLRGYTTTSVPFDTTFTCEGQSFVIGDGRLNPVRPFGIGVAAMPDGICRFLPHSGNAPLATVFVKTAQDAPIYRFTGNEVQHVRSAERLRALNGGSNPRVLTWSRDSVARVPAGPPALADGSFVAFAGRSEVYYAENGNLRHVTTADALIRLGGGRWPAVETLPAAFVGRYPSGEAITR